MTSSPCIDQINRAFERAGEARFSELLQFDADEILERRIDYLTLYTDPALPSEITKLYEQAITLTRAAHYSAAVALQIFETTSAFQPFDRPYLYALATARLDRNWETITLPPDEVQREFRDLNRATLSKVLSVMVQWSTKQRPDESLQEAIENAFADAGELEQRIATSKAPEIQVVSEQIELSAKLIHVQGIIAAYWRFMFYRAILVDLGSDLEDEAYEAASKKTLVELSKTLLCQALPIVEILETAQKIFEAVRVLGNKKRALTQSKNEFAKLNAKAQDYITSYMYALVMWFTKANEMNEKFTYHVTQESTNLVALMQRVSESYSDLLPHTER